MKPLFPILLLVCLGMADANETPQSSTSPPSAPKSATPANALGGKIELDKEALDNANKAKAVIEQGIQALGGQAFLTLRDREQQGRLYGFHAGRPTGGGALFWGFSQFPDRERVELTKERDIAELRSEEHTSELQSLRHLV